MKAFFHPRAIAHIGASERSGSVGNSTYSNLLRGGFTGPIFPVNPNAKTVFGKQAYRSILDIPSAIDLAVLTTPAATIPELVSQCIKKSIPAAVIISAGFKEAGEAGKKLEADLIELARGKIRLIGPNCLGIMSPSIGLNATFAQCIAKPGNVAFLSQSGALCTAILDWSLKESIGFSGFVSTGSMADVSWADLLDYFGKDENTKSIVIYMESVGDARSFLSAAREVSLSKPIIVIKAGHTQAAAKAAASHTGSLTGSDAVLDAAFRRCGVLRVQEISELFYMADILGKQPLPKGRRLAIITNAGGPGVLATDELVSGGGELAALSPESLTKLNTFLPSAWSHANPIDILGDASADRYAKTLQAVIEETNSDGALVITTPQGMTDPLEIAKQLTPYAQEKNKPIFASWMGGGQVEAGSNLLNQAGIPSFPFPDAAVRAFNYMWKFQENIKMLYETPRPSNFTEEASARKKVETLFTSIRASGRTLLTEYESKYVMECYGIPSVPTRIAKTADEAVLLAKELGFPSVLKVHSETITHKTDVGAVLLNLNSEVDVREAFKTIQKNILRKASAKDFLGVTVQPMVSMEGYELILGSSIDMQFGPVLLFGSGGQLVEVYKDHALALPPLTTTLARRTMERTKIFTALQGVRGRKAVDIQQLEQILVRFAEIVVNHPEISEIDINPLLASEDRCLALDARVVLLKSEDQVVAPAIRPYPAEYYWSIDLKNKEKAWIRPIRPEDENLLIDFFTRASAQVTHQQLTRICFIDYAREINLVAETIIGNERRLIALARNSNSIQIDTSWTAQGLEEELSLALQAIEKTEAFNSSFTKSR